MSAPQDHAHGTPAPDLLPPEDASPQHPGLVTFVDADSFAEYQVAIESLPWEVAWADSEAGLVPVTRVIGRRRAGSFDVESYGVDGRLLHVVSRPTTD